MDLWSVNSGSRQDLGNLSLRVTNERLCWWIPSLELRSRKQFWNLKTRIEAKGENSVARRCFQGFLTQQESFLLPIKVQEMDKWCTYLRISVVYFKIWSEAFLASKFWEQDTYGKTFFVISANLLGIAMRSNISDHGNIRFWGFNK